MRTRRPPAPLLPGLDLEVRHNFQDPKETPRPATMTPPPSTPALTEPAEQPDLAHPRLKPGAALQLEPAPSEELQKARDAVLAILADGDWHPYEDVWMAGRGLYHQVTVWGPERVKWPGWLLPVDCRGDTLARVALWDGKASRERRGVLPAG